MAPASFRFTGVRAELGIASHPLSKEHTPQEVVSSVALAEDFVGADAESRPLAGTPSMAGVALPLSSLP